MLEKRRLKKQGVVKVTFVLPGDLDADRIEVAGDWTDWEPMPLERRGKDNSWRASVDLEPERSYQYRYRIDGERWMNDPDADGYADNPFGDQNSVVET